MNKKNIARMLVLVLMVSLLSLCASARTTSATPYLTFSGTTVNCVGTCYGTASSDTVKLSMTLRENGTPVAGWNGSGTGSASLSKTYAGKSGASYTLVLNYSINGTAQPAVSVTKTCP